MGEKKRRRDAEAEAEAGVRLTAVGRPVPDDWRRSIPPEGGGALALARTQAVILTGFPGLSVPEARAARSAPLEIAMLPCGDALVLVAHVEGYATLDLPYDHSVPPPGARGVPDREPHQGLMFLFVAFDTASGILRAQRAVSVTPQFADVLGAEVAALDKRAGSPDWHCGEDLRKAYARWKDPAALLAAATYRETAGMAFPGQRAPVPPPAGSH